VIHGGRRCIGFAFRRANGFEAYDHAERSIGLFDTENAAVAAVFQHAGGEQ
jgi:hypothetical protein